MTSMNHIKPGDDQYTGMLEHLTWFVGKHHCAFQSKYSLQLGHVVGDVVTIIRSLATPFTWSVNFHNGTMMTVPYDDLPPKVRALFESAKTTNRKDTK